MLQAVNAMLEGGDSSHAKFEGSDSTPAVADAPEAKRPCVSTSGLGLLNQQRASMAWAFPFPRQRKGRIRQHSNSTSRFGHARVHAARTNAFREEVDEAKSAVHERERRCEQLEQQQSADVRDRDLLALLLAEL